MNVLETERLILRWLSADDAAFILELVNDPAWLRFIGDRGVRTLEDARDYILNGPVAMYRRTGFGLYLVELKQGATPIGMCGLIERVGLEDIDIGFAFLPAFCGQGYAYESASAMIRYAQDTLGLNRVVAIVDPDNQRSITLLTKLGLSFVDLLRLGEDQSEVMLFAWNKPA
ncbi:MAG: GNAT family N-acetyltransferase [Roseiflexaceae bacterium]